MSHAWMPLYIADYLADTTHLSTVEHGAYMLLIMTYWQKGCLPDDERKLARICRLTDAEWSDIRDTIAGLFGPGWTHKRIDEELSSADEIIAKRKAAGKAGASARYSNRIANAMANAQQTDQQTHTPLPSPIPKSSLHSDLGGACAPAPSPEKPKVRKIGTRIPDDWAPSPANVEYAKAKGLPEHRIPTEAERFRNHFRQKSGKDAVKLDWDATWHNWVLRACDFGGFTPKAFNVVRATVWVTNEDPRWLLLADRYRKERGRDPPTRGGNGGQGWDFPADWVSPAGRNSAAA